MRKIGKEVFIHPEARIDVDYLEIGDFSKINKGVIIRGRKVIIGREAWLDEGARIGGGRAELGSLQTGDFLHLGRNTLINIACDVRIGHEVGMNGNIFTHGAYLNRLAGFPYQVGKVTIGNEVWLPKADILPNVTIGSCTVVAAGSLVNRDLPSGCFAGGVPAKILKKNVFPREVNNLERIAILGEVRDDARRYGVDFRIDPSGEFITTGGTDFNVMDLTIVGGVSKATERVKDILRRHGIRFRYYNKDGKYVEWENSSSFSTRR